MSLGSHYEEGEPRTSCRVRLAWWRRADGGWMIVLVAFLLVAFVHRLTFPFSSSSSSSCHDNLGLLWRLDHFAERTFTLERSSALRFWPSFQPHVLLRYLSSGRIVYILYFFFLFIHLLRLVRLHSGHWIVSVQSSLSTNGTR
jgi:hypothetical protein